MKNNCKFPMTAVICIASVAFYTSLWISIIAINYCKSSKTTEPVEKNI